MLCVFSALLQHMVTDVFCQPRQYEDWAAIDELEITGPKVSLFFSVLDNSNRYDSVV